MESKGRDITGMRDDITPQELWDKENVQDEWYNKAVAYWDRQDATNDGVLGGYGHVSDADIVESERFLSKMFKRCCDTGRKQLTALDCGAGIGRVSEHLLLRFFAAVDLIEPSRHLLDTAKRRLTGAGPKPFPPSHKPVGFFQMGLQDFTPQPGRYDVIWVQWALLYLTDDDMVAFFQRAVAGLRPGGVVFVKENVCATGFVVDNEDASVTRSNVYLQELFERAGLRLLATAQQRSFPKGLFPVRMFALQPRSGASSGSEGEEHSRGY